ncbi:MAG: TlpA disulfide reductase family protein [Flavobacteriaceae bacterium]|nr:TlpA disulfide reductase family protein [Flavobacteriaceae bacterium]
MDKRLMKLLAVFFLLGLQHACKTESKPVELQEGIWRGEIHMQNQKLPFNFEITKKDGSYKANLINAEEILPLDEVTIVGDSLFITLHIFDIDLKAKIEATTLNGYYIKNYKENYKLPFKAVYNKSGRFDQPESSGFFDGKWQTTFTEEDGKTYPAVGIFNQDGDVMKGTFLTETGDYRYLEGTASGNKMSLYTFDGNHAFIFNATVENDSLMKGEFLSGLDYRATFSGTKDKDAKLTDATKLTYLKEGYDKVAFSFPGLDGASVSLSDNKYQNKVVLLQIFGTWCPNCMDETVFYADWYRKNKDRSVEIIGLAYEAKDDFNYAKARVEKMKQKYDVGYDYVIAGVYDKEAAARTLPMLNHVLSFPTTIFIDKKGEVRRIHTGFSGPATGSYYDEFVKDFEDFMEQLISE